MSVKKLTSILLIFEATAFASVLTVENASSS